MLTTSATVTCASTVNAAGRSSRPASSRIGSTSAAEPVASRSANTAAWAPPWKRLSRRPPGIASAAATPAAIDPRRMLPTSARFRIGTFMPAENISITKPTLARNATVSLVVSSQPNPVRPMTMPATISPTTTGKSCGRAPESRGPPSPAQTISARIPKLTGGA